MAAMDTSAATIQQRLLTYLADQGFHASPVQHAEILARVQGFGDVEAQERYNAQLTQLRVLPLHMEDVDAAGSIRLNRTLESAPLLETFSKKEANVFALSQATQLATPMVLVNGANELVGHWDDPVQTLRGNYECWLSVAPIASPAPTQVYRYSDDLRLVGCFANKRLAVAHAKSIIPEGDPADHCTWGLLVADLDSRVVWCHRTEACIG